jgi:hypothetical protein
MLPAFSQSLVEVACASIPLRSTYETIRCHNPERQALNGRLGIRSATRELNNETCFNFATCS